MYCSTRAIQAPNPFPQENKTTRSRTATNQCLVNGAPQTGCLRAHGLSLACPAAASHMEFRNPRPFARLTSLSTDEIITAQ